MGIENRESVVKEKQEKKSEECSRWRLPSSVFAYQKKVLLKHTNLEGNVYYDNYLTWQGEAREALLLSHPYIEEFLKPENFIKMITHSVYHRFMRDTFFGQSLRIEVTSREIKRCSFILIFKFYAGSEETLIGEGWQKICLSNPTTGRICRIPDVILDLIAPIREKDVA